MNVEGKLVSIVIPAHNAELTIERTLQSAVEQTYTPTEIIVVDDGSSDNTAGVVRRMTRSNRNITLLSQNQFGVARARNHGIARARGSYIAPLDADDLWHAEKIRRQVDLIEASSAEVALVYTWHRLIDEQDAIIRSGPRVNLRGSLLGPLLFWNFIGSASSPLLRREAVLGLGGYSSDLFDSGAQGCEDLDLYIRLAERYAFEVVPAYLIGYRVTNDAMSSDAKRMMKSWRLVIRKARSRGASERALVLKWGEATMMRWLCVRALRQGQPSYAFRLCLGAAVRDPVILWQKMLSKARRSTRRVGTIAKGSDTHSTGRLFFGADPNRGGDDLDPAMIWRIKLAHKLIGDAQRSGGRARQSN